MLSSSLLPRYRNFCWGTSGISSGRIWANTVVISSSFSSSLELSSPFFLFLCFFFLESFLCFFFFFFAFPVSAEDSSESPELLPSDSECFFLFLALDLTWRTNSPQLAIFASIFGRLFSSVSKFSIFETTSFPKITCPNTVCLLSRWGAGFVVMKNWEPFVSFPRLAMDKRKSVSCFVTKFSSGKNPS